MKNNCLEFCGTSWGSFNVQDKRDAASFLKIWILQVDPVMYNCNR